MTVSLDKENHNIGYRLGRLFAVLEKVSVVAQPNINATIRDRYYSASFWDASKRDAHFDAHENHHLAKLPHKGSK